MASLSFLMVFRDCLGILYQLSVYYPQGDPLEAPRAKKNNYMLNFNNFSTTILDLKMSLDRAHQDLKLYLKKEY